MSRLIDMMMIGRAAPNRWMTKEAGAPSSSWLKVNEKDLVFRAQPGPPAPGGGPERAAVGVR